MLADLARRDGERVVAFDLFGDLDLRRSASRVVTPSELGGGGLSALVGAAAMEEASGVVYGASFENHPALVARLAERHALLGNAPGTLRAVRDPAMVGAALRDADVPYPRTFVTGLPNASVCSTGERSRRWLRKPLRGGGGTCVHEWRGGALPAGAFVQERIDGLACSAAAVGDGVDAVVLGLTEQLVGQRAFGVRGHRWCGNLVPPRLPAGEREALLDQARAICSCLAGTFALRGLFGVDVMWDGERAWTIEVNPRPTASLEAIEAVGTHPPGVFDAHLRACAGELRRIEPECLGAAGKAVLFATENVVIGDSVRWLERGVRDVPHPGERIAAGRPICTVMTTAATSQDALAGLEEQAMRLRAELEARVEVAAGG
jgi:predicted ATP-grasp superfamily ATP-dependent carboligase